jgi:hypothetical protein
MIQHIYIIVERVVSCDYPILIFAGNWSDGIDLAEESYARPYKPSPEDYHLVGTFKQTFIG